jgi:HAD superfamily phosphoserine phosphatase-like hydrolase
MLKDIKIVAFDLDGVLYDGPSAAFHLAQQVGIGQKYQELFTRMASEKLSFDESLRLGAESWKGIEFGGEYRKFVFEMPLMRGTERTLDVLRKKGYQVGCISSGVSQFFMEPFAERLHLDFAYSNILGIAGNTHSGEIEFVMGTPQKAETALRILEEKNLSTENLASVGNGENDIDLFGVSGFSIAYNPISEIVSGAATATVHSKNLEAILEYFV